MGERALGPGRGDVGCGVEHGSVVFPFCGVAIEGPGFAEFADVQAVEGCFGGEGAGVRVVGCVCGTRAGRGLDGGVGLAGVGGGLVGHFCSMISVFAIGD